MRRALFVLTVLAIQVDLAHAQDGTTAPNSAAQTSAETLVKLHQAWGAQASTPNLTLTIKQLSQSGQTVSLRLIAPGLPKGVTYSLIAWPVTQKGPSRSLTGITTDESGVAICAGLPGTCGRPENPNDPIDLVMQPVPGEPIRLGLVSDDGATKVFAKLVPFPLRGEDRGCSVEAVLLTPGAEVVLVIGNGFSPTSKVAMDTASGSEHHGSSAQTDAKGAYTSAILPFRQGVARGRTKVSLAAPHVRRP